MSLIQRILAPRRAMVGVIAVAALAGTAYYINRLYNNHRLKTMPLSKLRESESDEKRVDDEDASDDDSGIDDNDDDDLEPFLPVIEALDQDALKHHAIQARLSQIIKPSVESDVDLTCTISGEPVAGSFNLVYFISFSDGYRMVARLPGNGPDFGEPDRRKMDHEYHTMRLIKAQTSIPIPEVFTWHSTSLSVGVPFALMSFMPGTPIFKRWSDPTWSTAAKRAKMLEQIATHMSQLHKLEFDGLGAPLFNQQGQLLGVGPRYDYVSGFHSNVPWSELQTSGPWATMQDYQQERWDAAEEKSAGNMYETDTVVMRLATESIPEYMFSGGKSYIRHPDMNWQNIFVDDDANITAFIDWDGVDTSPMSMGFAAYPSWITRDWDPAMYGYDDEDEELTAQSDDVAPVELSSYRRKYAAVFEGFALPGYDSRETRLSHIVEAITIAMENRFCRDWIVPKILLHAFHGKIPFSYRQFSKQYLAGEGEATIKIIKEAFDKMWFAEWEASESEQAIFSRSSNAWWEALKD
jgi:aminoglycoside phosphotransferase (APT) family kinase protein